MGGKALRARLPVLIGGGVLLLLLAALVWMIKGFIGDAEPPAKRQVQQISLVKPPPLKVEEKPPEEKPPEVKEEVPMELPNPEPAANNEPPPDDAVGSNLGPGNDGFGLGKGNGSGRIGGGGSRFGWYASILQQTLQDQLARNEKAKQGDYKVMVKIWVSPTGVLERYELMNSSGTAEVDAALRQILAGLRELREAPPPDMPQPIKLRIVSR